MNMTFILPGDACSGGIRVTMQLANSLLLRGHAVRIAYRRPPTFSTATLVSRARSIKFLCSGITETRWLRYFNGKKESFLSLDALRFANNEVVIAVGNDAIGELQRLQRSVIKVRFCHGLVENSPDEMQRLWGGSMLTIAVSPRLVPILERYCKSPIVGIVSNGISPNEYFVENRNRNGVGFIFHGSPLKGAEVAGPLLNALHERLPQIPCFVFGSFPKPRVLEHCEYTRYPSIAKAREIYNRCRIWLITSKDEGFCLPILEAMACGCAVVSSRHTNSAELITHGLNGFTVPYADIAGYTKISEKLLSDESLRSRVVQEGFKTVRRFTWEAAATSMEELLVKAITNRNQELASNALVD